MGVAWALVRCAGGDGRQTIRGSLLSGGTQAAAGWRFRAG
jgi:hypothetical protein